MTTVLLHSTHQTLFNSINLHQPEDEQWRISQLLHCQRWGSKGKFTTLKLMFPTVQHSQISMCAISILSEWGYSSNMSDIFYYYYCHSLERVPGSFLSTEANPTESCQASQSTHKCSCLAPYVTVAFLTPGSAELILKQWNTTGGIDEG